MAWLCENPKCPYTPVVRGGVWTAVGALGLGSGGSGGLMVWELAQQNGPMAAGSAAAAGLLGAACGGLVKWLKKPKRTGV